MPNWCNNKMTIGHSNFEMIKKAADAWNSGKGFLNQFIPIPDKGDWYEFCCREWGTKWDIGNQDDEKAEITANKFTVQFDSAWSPPIAAYEKLSEMGFKITAYYAEFGMMFCGRWDDGDDYYTEIPPESASVKREIPTDIDEIMGIKDTLEEFEEINHA